MIRFQLPRDELAADKFMTKRESTPIAWGGYNSPRGPGRTSSFERLADGDGPSTPRSVNPDSRGYPPAVTNPKPHYSVPKDIPESSRARSTPQKLAPLVGAASSAKPDPLSLTRTEGKMEAESAGKHLYDAARRGQVWEISRLLRKGPSAL